jgi:UDP-N-acetylglucosamine 2-epimerase (non-hydrolysing)
LTQAPPTRLICVAGARPNFMKVAPLIRALRQGPFQPVLVHTGQHYDDVMSGQFFRDLDIAPPDHFMGVGSGSHAQQTAAIMTGFEPILLSEKPDGVVVVGDVNSTVACALVAAKLNVPVVHVEAGLRSFDRRMPEEINRLVTDAIAGLLLVTEESGRFNLRAEGVPEERIRLVGNLMIDTLRFNLAKSENSTVRERLGAVGAYGVVTLHRPANVDDPAQLREILSALEAIAEDVPLYFPVHPRTRSMLEKLDVSSRIHLVEPLGYLDFLRLMTGSSVVLTDSGGIQEETTALGIPCLTLRENTERPITVEMGTNRLAGIGRDGILRAWEESKSDPKRGRVPPLWDGEAANRCVQALAEFFRGGTEISTLQE